jgi:hypothetical protein
MNPIVRNILAVIAGLVSGSILNMGIILISSSVIPPPEGANLTTPEGLIAAMPLMQPIHFLMPFLAHALGTLLGAWVSTFIANKNQLTAALIIAALFFVGGAMNIAMLPSPMWFNIVDLVFAYFPMAYLALKIRGIK